MSLKDCIAHDVDRVFLNTSDFCDNITFQVGIVKYNIVGSLQSNTVQNNSGNSAPLQSDSWTLYIKYPLEGAVERAILSSGKRVTINDKPFTVVSISDECGLATVQLSTTLGR